MKCKETNTGVHNAFGYGEEWTQVNLITRDILNTVLDVPFGACEGFQCGWPLVGRGTDIYCDENKAYPGRYIKNATYLQGFIRLCGLTLTVLGTGFGLHLGLYGFPIKKTSLGGEREIMATSSFDETFIITDKTVKKLFYEVYYGNDGVTVHDLEKKSQALKDEAKAGIARLKKNLVDALSDDEGTENYPR